MKRFGLIGLGLLALTAFALIFLAQRDERGAVPTGGPDRSAELAQGVTPPAPDASAAPVGEPPARRFEGGAWVAGVRAYQDHDDPTAREALELAVQERGDIAVRHYLLGLTYLRLGEADAAAEQLAIADSLGPNNVRTLVNLARARIAQGQLDGARAAIEGALQAEPQDGDAWLVLGRVELGAGHLEEAATAFTRATELAPSQAYGWNNLGYARIQQERFGDAVPPLRTAIRLRDDVASFFNNLGIALERTDDLAGAHLAFGRATELGHALAAASQSRVDGLLVARGLPLPAQEDLAALVGQDTLTVSAGQPASTAADSTGTSAELATSVKR